MNKKDYKTLLKLLDSTFTTVALSNKLAELGINAIDPKLARIAKTLSAIIRPAPHDKGTTRVRLLTLAPILATTSPHVNKQLAAKITNAKKYCDECLESVEPMWMICAKAAGWIPPPN